MKGNVTQRPKCLGLQEEGAEGVQEEERTVVVAAKRSALRRGRPCVHLGVHLVAELFLTWTWALTRRFADGGSGSRQKVKISIRSREFQVCTSHTTLGR